MKKWERNNKYIYFYVLSVCSDRVRQLSMTSVMRRAAETARLWAPRPAHKLTTAGCREEQSGRFRHFLMSRNPSELPSFPLLWTPFASHFGSRVDAKGRCACVRVNGMRCWDKRKEAKPLRQVHRKVLRNWQVNCAMHAWAMPLGERRAQDLSITTFWSTPAPHFTMSTLLQT